MKIWEDEEDEYLSRAVYEHMTLNDEQVCYQKVGKLYIWRSPNKYCLFYTEFM